MKILHHPFYCEENIWQLCADVAHEADAQVAVISNERQAVALWEQRAGREDDGFVVWDYHVIMLLPGESGWQVLDLDSRLGHPLAVKDYLSATWPASGQLSRNYHPQFRVIPARDYRRELRTDRSHMRRHDGGWLRQPPPWPQLADHSNLAHFVGMGSSGPGEVLNLTGFIERFDVS